MSENLYRNRYGKALEGGKEGENKEERLLRIKLRKMGKKANQ